MQCPLADRSRSGATTHTLNSFSFASVRISVLIPLASIPSSFTISICIRFRFSSCSSSLLPLFSSSSSSSSSFPPSRIFRKRCLFVCLCVCWTGRTNNDFSEEEDKEKKKSREMFFFFFAPPLTRSDLFSLSLDGMPRPTFFRFSPFLVCGVWLWTLVDPANEKKTTNKLFNTIKICCDALAQSHTFVSKSLNIHIIRQSQKRSLSLYLHVYLCNLQSRNWSSNTQQRGSLLKRVIQKNTYLKWRQRKLRSRTRRISPSVPPVVSSKLAYRVRFSFLSVFFTDVMLARSFVRSIDRSIERKFARSEKQKHPLALAPSSLTKIGHIITFFFPTISYF